MIDRGGSEWTLIPDSGERRIYARSATLSGILTRWYSLRNKMLREGAVASVKEPLYTTRAQRSKRRLEIREKAALAGDMDAAGVKVKRVEHSVIDTQ